jgi:hypothetical protein
VFVNAASAGLEIAKSIPFAGTALITLEILIGTCWAMFKKLRYEQRVNSINHIIM